jgi:lysophospholipase L1-like esterase
MTTLKAGNKNYVTLLEGHILTLVAGANSSGVAYQCTDSSGTNSVQSWNILAGATQVIGPFTGDYLIHLECAAGLLTATLSMSVIAVANKQASLLPGSGGRDSIAPYLGIVATRCGCFDNGFFGSTIIASTNRSAHYATEDLTSIKLVYGNWTIVNNAESNMDSAASIVCFIEYPIDTYTRVTFNGANTGAAAAGANFVSDFVSVNIPRGAVFYVRVGYGLTGTTVNGVATNGTMRPNWGAGTTTGSYWEGILNSTSLASVSLAGTKGSGGTSGNNDGFNTQASNRIVPLGILGMTTRPSFFIAGDSISVGIGDIADSQLAAGFIARALGNKYGYFAGGASGEGVNGLTGNSQFLQRSFMAQFCTHVISNYGTNDIGVASGRTPAQVIADISSFRAKWFPTQRFYQTTMLPRTTSTDGWATEVNQTVLATDANRALLNDSLRLGALTSRFDGILDVDQIAQNSYNGRLWKAFGTTTNRMTADGTHPTPYGAQYIASQLNIGRML